MELKTTDQIREYLNSKNIPFNKVTELPGGSGNFIWRLESAGEPDSIIKHAEPYVKAAPTLPFPQERMDFEVKVIRLLNNTAVLRNTASQDSQDSSEDKSIVLPTVFYYDQERHILQINYAGPKTLKEAYQNPSLDIPACGSRIGAWLAKLHSLTRSTAIGKNEGAKIYRFAYQRLEKSLEDWGFDPALGARINNKYGVMLDTDDEMVCHGDCWPGNFIMSEDLNTLTVVDWEMTRRGCGATDIGQFLAEAYLLDFFQGGRGLAPSFLKSYKASSDITKSFAERAAVHFGVHASFWPTRVEWGSREQTLKVVQLGVEVLNRVEAQDWDWLRDSVLGDIFRDIE
ncbi:hypothetical protein MMC10_001811 [Thelotrema lepadinum]|nr:hypothetical protein [Thelotrema lepadinum]